MVDPQTTLPGTARAASRDGTDPRWSRFAWLWAPLYAVLWVTGYEISSYYWFLPAGLRIGCLLLAPRRMWGWLLLGEAAAIIWLFQGTISYQSWISAALGNGPPWLIGAAVVAIGWRAGARPSSPASMIRLLLLCLIAALLVAPLVALQQFLEDIISRDEVPQMLVGMAVGDFVSMIIVAPSLLTIADMRSRDDLGELLRQFLAPILLPLIACALIAWVWPEISAYLMVLALTPMMLIAFRHGWRGGAIALLMSAFAVYAIGELGELAIDRALMQLIVAVIGSGVLMLGAAVDSIRANNRELADNVAAISEANKQLLSQSNELSELSRRLVRVQEEEQQRIAGELQDELGQSMSTMGVRLGLASRQSRDPELLAVVDAVREMVRDLHTTIRGVVSRLAPTPPKAQGFIAALRDGTIGHLLGEAGINARYVVDEGLERLVDSQRTLLFRMCQEAATDAIRRGQVDALELSISLDNTAPVSVSFRISQELHPQPAHGVMASQSDNRSEHRGIRDRVRGADGTYRRWQEGQTLIAEVRIPALFKSS